MKRYEYLRRVRTQLLNCTNLPTELCNMIVQYLDPGDESSKLVLRIGENRGTMRLVRYDDETEQVSTVSENHFVPQYRSARLPSATGYHAIVGHDELYSLWNLVDGTALVLDWSVPVHRFVIVGTLLIAHSWSSSEELFYRSLTDTTSKWKSKKVYSSVVRCWLYSSVNIVCRNKIYSYINGKLCPIIQVNNGQIQILPIVYTVSSVTKIEAILSSTSDHHGGKIYYLDPHRVIAVFDIETGSTVTMKGPKCVTSGPYVIQSLAFVFGKLIAACGNRQYYACDLSNGKWFKFPLALPVCDDVRFVE